MGIKRTLTTRTRPQSPLGTAAVGGVRALRAVRGVVTPLGWGIAATMVLALFLAGRLGWRELLVLGLMALFLLLIAAPFLIGRATLKIDVTLQPTRVSVGNPAAGQVSITNVATRRLWPIRLELPVGTGVARFNLPSLGAGKSLEELFVMPTTRRAVVPVGPARTVRGDPLGLLRREVAWTDVTELYVHPRIVGLDPLGSGLLRDLEGQASTNISSSDLAFHTLRDYVAGDDRRHIHWRTTARTGQLTVRQFVDTRRIHVTVIVDGNPASYADPDEFEIALSVAGSICVRAVQDDQQASTIASDQAVADGTVRQLLDGLTRAELGTAGEHDLRSLAGSVLRTAPDTSVAFLVTGSRPDVSALRHAATAIPAEIERVAIRVMPSRETALATVGPLQLLTLPALTKLPALMRVVAAR